MKFELIILFLHFISVFGYSQRPVIGILTIPSDYDEYPSSEYSYFPAKYVK
jgi:hypothetical protein